MGDLEEWQVNLTTDSRTGHATGFMLHLDDTGQWGWVDDRDFGPFDTSLDIATWITRCWVKDLKRRMV